MVIGGIGKLDKRETEEGKVYYNMVLILDGSSEIGARVISNICLDLFKALD